MTGDWRSDILNGLPYLRGQSFVHKHFEAYRPGWEHDHCAVCGATFAESSVEADDILHEGYSITSDYVRGEDYEWVCEECFAASKACMGWKDVTAA